MTANDSLAGPAARALIAERCQRAYLHDVRGGLQALSGALELLGRLALCGAGAAATVEHAVSLAKRALAAHESALLDLVKQITGGDESTERLELAALLEDVLRFLCNELASRRIATQISAGPQIHIDAPRNQLRFVLLGLLTRRIDALPAGGTLVIGIERRDGSAVLTLRASSAGAELESFDPVLRMAHDWAGARGGMLRASAAAGTLELHWPAVAPP